MSGGANLLMAGAAAITALGIIWAALRRSVRALVDVVRVVRQLLELQPRMVELGERLVQLVDEHQNHAGRLALLEAAVYTRSETTHNAP